MKSLQISRSDSKLVVVGALLTVLAYPPFHLFAPSFISLIPAVLLIMRSSADEQPLRRSWAQGFWFGFASQSLILYWLVIALWRFTPLSLLAFLATVALYGVYTGIVFMLVGWIGRKTAIPIALSFPALWTGMDWWIGHQGDIAFPWLGLGTSLTAYPVVVQLADIVGARGITFLLAVANTVLALAWLESSRPRRRWTLVGGVLAGLVASISYGAVRMRTVDTTVGGNIALIQPNIGFREKWEPGAQDSLFGFLTSMSEEAIRVTDPDLVIWPEAAVPNYFFNHPQWELAIASQARSHAVPIVVGGFDIESYGDGGFDYYNTAFLFDETGSSNAQQPYHKRYLVPIVERVPFLTPSLLNMKWFGGFGVGDPGTIFDTEMGSFGVMICYESAFEDVARDYKQRGADFLVNITNDAWYGETSAPYQHAAHLVMRAIENRVGIARGANNGISEFVDPLGRTYGETRLGERLFTSGRLIMSDASSLYSKLGDWVGLLSVGVSILLCLYARTAGTK
ncbi:MAG: apolipoprotein N-acyltransferase [Gemmatimonadetes bacterium]|nr:apolipoprotein N-acyltransferase [Gemmatimonadota bacterium]